MKSIILKLQFVFTLVILAENVLAGLKHLDITKLNNNSKTYS